MLSQCLTNADEKVNFVLGGHWGNWFLLGKYWPVIGKSLTNYWFWDVGRVLGDYWENVFFSTFGQVQHKSNSTCVCVLSVCNVCSFPKAFSQKLSKSLLLSSSLAAAPSSSSPLPPPFLFLCVVFVAFASPAAACNGVMKDRARRAHSLWPCFARSSQLENFFSQPWSDVTAAFMGRILLGGPDSTSELELFFMAE